MHPPEKFNPAELAQQRILLDALVRELRATWPIVEACDRWEEQLNVRTAERTFQEIAPHDRQGAAAEYAAVLRKAATTWMRGTFQRGVIATLRQLGCPAPTAVLLAPWMLYAYLDWTRCHVPPERPWPDPPEGPPVPTLIAPIRGIGKRGPKKNTAYIEEWAHWFFRVDICGESTAGVAKHYGYGSGHEPLEAGHTRIRDFRRTLNKARRLLLFWPPSARRPGLLERARPLVSVPKYVSAYDEPNFVRGYDESPQRRPRRTSETANRPKI